MSNPYEAPSSHAVSGLLRSWTLKRVDPVSCGKVTGLFYFFITAIFCALGIIFGLIGVVAGGGGQAGAAIGMIFFMILAPFLYGGLGFLGGWLSGAIFNVVVKYAGGVNFEVEES